MKYNHPAASPFADQSTPSRWSVSDRRAALLLYAGPIAIALMAFSLAVITTLLGEMEKGSLRFYAAAFSYSFLIACVMTMPAYLAGYGWYCWWTKDDDRRLTSGLWLAPLVAALFAWFPTTLFPSLNKLGGLGVNAFQIYLMTAALTLIFGYLWSCLVRLILRLWRKI